MLVLKVHFTCAWCARKWERERAFDICVLQLEYRTKNIPSLYIQFSSCIKSFRYRKRSHVNKYLTWLTNSVGKPIPQQIFFYYSIILFIQNLGINHTVGKHMKKLVISGDKKIHVQVYMCKLSHTLETYDMSFKNHFTELFKNLYIFISHKPNSWSKMTFIYQFDNSKLSINIWSL